jgi:hypothetical protein
VYGVICGQFREPIFLFGSASTRPRLGSDGEKRLDCGYYLVQSLGSHLGIVGPGADAGTGTDTGTGDAVGPVAGGICPILYILVDFLLSLVTKRADYTLATSSSLLPTTAPAMAPRIPCLPNLYPPKKPVAPPVIAPIKPRSPPTFSGKSH